MMEVDPGSHDEAPIDDGAMDAVPVPVPPQARKSTGRSMREWGLVIFVALAAALLLKVFVVQQFYVSGESMDTTLHNNDRVLVNKLSYHLHDPKRGDVIVLEGTAGVAEKDLIKRVIGLPGETIQMKSCVVSITAPGEPTSDARVLTEPYLNLAIATANECGGDFGPVTIPAHHVFVMGDNRPNSGDSRQLIGPVDYSQIVGRAFVVIWPTSDWRWL